MAGDWIKWVKGLTWRREVLAMSKSLGLSARETAATCMEVWEWADSNSTTGFIDGLDIADIDPVVNVAGFGSAMHTVGWLERRNGGLQFPRWDRHNSQSAKERALNADRNARRRRRDDDGAQQARQKRAQSASPSPSDSDSGSEGDMQGGREPPGFERWWKSWPGRKTKKQQCLAIWQGHKPTADGEKRDLEPIADEIVDAVERQKRAKHWRGNDGKDYIPNSSTWLYNGGWLDEVDDPPDQAKSPPDPVAELAQAEYDRLLEQGKGRLRDKARKNIENTSPDRKAAAERSIVKDELKREKSSGH